MTIDELLCARYPAKTHALLFEVRDAAGFGASRTCDAIAISTWPSRGLKLMGFEIKASRADWLREYRNPEKAESFQSVCDEWYVVADGKDIVHPDELPDTWGWLQRLGNRLICAKPAPPLKPAPIDRSFLAALLKRAIDQSSKPSDEARQLGYEAGKKAAHTFAEERAANSSRELDALKKRVYDFERASGISLLYSSEDGTKIGELVRMVQRGGHRALERFHAASRAQVVAPVE